VLLQSADLNVQSDTVAPVGAGHGGLPATIPIQRFTSHQTLPCYRLIDSGCQPHRQLDRQYGSIAKAIADAI